MNSYSRSFWNNLSDKVSNLPTKYERKILEIILFQFPSQINHLKMKSFLVFTLILVVRNSLGEFFDFVLILRRIRHKWRQQSVCD